MFVTASPESAGISSRSVLKYLRVLDSHGLAAHSVLIARGNRLICEAYWKPYDRTVRHRMYSQTKSYVGVAVRLLADEGKISLDDKIISYFPDKLPEKIHPYLEKLTVRNMLMMRTCFDEYDVNWFRSGTDDRVKLYFSQTPAVYPGTQYRYDSMGSFVLGALVERLTGMTFLDYLREKCLNDIGFSADAYCLRCPGGHSWADSGLICTPLDMLTFGRFVGRLGEWDGKQLVRRGLFEEMLADRSDCYEYGIRSYYHGGYSSQLWNYKGNAFGFNGMHDQLTFYDPDTDITFTCTSGNYRAPNSRELIISYLFSEIIETAGEPMKEDGESFGELREYIENLELVTADGEKHSPLESEIGGKIFFAQENAAGITRFSFDFSDTCKFNYENAQGEKSICFGRTENIFQQFPETGYSGETGGEKCEGHTYRCAASGAWGSENQLRIYVQIIDEYIGSLFINFAYQDGHGRIRMIGDGENFLTEYNAKINATAEC